MSACGILKWIAFGLAAAVGYLLLATPPAGLQPAYLGDFSPPPFDQTLQHIDVNRLQNHQKITFPEIGVQDVAVDSQGNIYTAVGIHNSSIYRIRPDNLTRLELLGTNQAPIMGVCLSPNQKKLALADQSNGLKLLDLETGVIETLVSQFEGRKFNSLNSITFTDDQTIYFTHTGNIGMDQYHLQILSKQPTGKIYKYNIKTRHTEIFVDRLHFPNGIVYSKQDNCLYSCHLNKYQIIRIPLDQKVGDNLYTVAYDNLPGFPDNLKITADNKLWVALPSMRDSITNFLDNYPFARKMVINAKIPLQLFLNLGNFSLSGAVKIDPNTGTIIDYFLGKSSEIYFVTTAYQQGKRLYLACLIHNFIAVFDY